MNPRYQKPRILKDLHLFDVDCSTHEHEVTFSNIEDHLNLKKNLEIFLKCIDLFGWPQKLAVTFANQDSSSKVEKKRSEEIQKATKSSRVNPPKSTSQEYLFSSFKRNEQRFINAELQSVVKPHELRSYKEWQGHFGKSPLK